MITHGSRLLSSAAHTGFLFCPIHAISKDRYLDISVFHSCRLFKKSFTSLPNPSASHLLRPTHLLLRGASGALTCLRQHGLKALRSANPVAAAELSVFSAQWWGWGSDGVCLLGAWAEFFFWWFSDGSFFGF